MIIGFTQRIRTVPESLSGQDSYRLSIEISVKTLSERSHEIGFRHQGSAVEQPGLATVRSFAYIDKDGIVDARFGAVDDDPIEQLNILQPGGTSIPSLITLIVNDFEPEEEECFSIYISNVDRPGDRDVFFCNPDPATEFFCVHTICITDDDSKLRAE